MTAYRSRIVDHGEANPAELLENPANWRGHPATQRAALEGVLEEVGWVQTVIVNQRTGRLIDGHLRVKVARERGEASVPVVYVDLEEEEERLILASLDPLSAMAETNKEQLAALMDSIDSSGERTAALLEGIRAQAGLGSLLTPKAEPRPTLADRFGVPPFSVLDARQGYWQERKRQWLSLGIQSELGRGDNLIAYSEGAATHYANAEPGGSKRPAAKLGPDGKTVRGDGAGAAMNTRPPHGPTVTQNPDGTLSYDASNNGEGASGTSVFDPVVCELAYRWFSPPDGAVLDPFAGGSVRGIVASVLGRSYTGVDLSERQIEANREQAASIVPDASPQWVVGDSIQIAALAPGEYDLLFSCPPYADLEVYSDDPRDLSTMPYHEFVGAYREIIAAAAGMLRDDRFACFVVGDIRDKRGMYRNFVSSTIQAFEEAGLRLYNEAILVTAVGSLSIRVGRQFEVGRKLGKTHQNVLVFVKGDPRKATEACGQIEIAPIDGLEAPEWRVIEDA